MADSERSKPELLALLLDNQEGKGRIKTVRELVLTVFGHLSIANPTVNNDKDDTAGLGIKFSIGSRWTNTNAETHYLCVNDATGAAVWINLQSAADLDALRIYLEGYADDGDAATLLSANAHSDANDATTLASANAHSDANDATTLASANAHSDANDAVTLGDAEDYTDAAILTRVPTTRNINTTSPMTGGGSLDVDLTLATPIMVGSGGGHTAGLAPDPGSVAGTTKFLREDATYAVPPGTATVTSVALTAPADFAVSGSPVTVSGTLTLTYANQSANVFLAGPSSGGAATPAYRPIVIADVGCHDTVRVTHSTTQTVATATPTALTFDTETWDTNALHSTSSNTSRLTATVGGKYLVQGSFTWDINSSGFRAAHILKNGATIYARKREPTIVSATAGTWSQVSGMVDLAAGDYVELIATQDSGTTRTIDNKEFSMCLMRS